MYNNDRCCVRCHYYDLSLSIDPRWRIGSCKLIVNVQSWPPEIVRTKRRAKTLQYDRGLRQLKFNLFTAIYHLQTNRYGMGNGEMRVSSLEALYALRLPRPKKFWFSFILRHDPEATIPCTVSFDPCQCEIDSFKIGWSRASNINNFKPRVRAIKKTLKSQRHQILRWALSKLNNNPIYSGCCYWTSWIHSVFGECVSSDERRDLVQVDVYMSNVVFPSQPFHYCLPGLEPTYRGVGVKRSMHFVISVVLCLLARIYCWRAPNYSTLHQH